MVSALDMATASLRGRGEPIRINSVMGTTDTQGFLFEEGVEGGNSVHTLTTVTIPKDVPVRERDTALLAGRDYVVRGVRGGRQFSKTLELERRA